MSVVRVANSTPKTNFSFVKKKVENSNLSNLNFLQLRNSSRVKREMHGSSTRVSPRVNLNFFFSCFFPFLKGFGKDFLLSLLFFYFAIIFEIFGRCQLYSSQKRFCVLFRSK